MPERDGRLRRDPAPAIEHTEVRRVPRVGDRVYIVHLAAWEEATIFAVHDAGRRLEVRPDEEETILEFVLSRATARFVSGGLDGPRLRWAMPQQDSTRGRTR